MCYTTPGDSDRPVAAASGCLSVSIGAVAADHPLVRYILKRKELRHWLACSFARFVHSWDGGKWPQISIVSALAPLLSLAGIQSGISLHTGARLLTADGIAAAS